MRECCEFAGEKQVAAAWRALRSLCASAALCAAHIAGSDRAEAQRALQHTSTTRIDQQNHMELNDRDGDAEELNVLQMETNLPFGSIVASFSSLSSLFSVPSLQIPSQTGTCCPTLNRQSLTAQTGTDLERSPFAWEAIDLRPPLRGSFCFSFNIETFKF